MGGEDPASVDDVAGQSKYVIEGLKKLYGTKLKSIEKKYLFNEFHSPLLSDADFDAKPQVLMIGQYSVGKTSFIEYLLGRSFPGQRIGPEPTTDRFVAVMHGPEERVIPGNALAVSKDMPYHGLSMFGTAFLNKFESAQLPCQQLENLTIVDTPGILSGEKQRLSRGYDFVQVTRWFAERSDLILLLFDAHKLDISDEFQRVIEVLKGHDDKIRCVLNKADQIDQQRLMRVYGALMWSMGKVLKTPEVLRVYIGSFWNEPLNFTDNQQLFEAEQKDLMDDLRSLPRNAAIRKINELVKRTRLAKVHAYVIGRLRDKMPAMMGKEKKQRELIDTLDIVFRDVQSKYQLPPGDFPDLQEFKEKLAGKNFMKFGKLNAKAISELDAILSTDIPKLMAALPKGTGKVSDDGGATSNPFAASAEQQKWIIAAHKAKYDELFSRLHRNSEGKATGVDCMEPMQATGCSQDELSQIWELADLDHDGCLDSDEFAVAMYLCNLVQEGETLPIELSPELVPPSKKKFTLSV